MHLQHSGSSDGGILLEKVCITMGKHFIPQALASLQKLPLFHNLKYQPSFVQWKKCPPVPDQVGLFRFHRHLPPEPAYPSMLPPVFISLTLLGVVCWQALFMTFCLLFASKWAVALDLGLKYCISTIVFFIVSKKTIYSSFSLLSLWRTEAN